MDAKERERHEHMQADHELFLQAFEKPTQIYRYLRTRNRLSPIFLHRTLTFMRKRLSRTNASRKGFKVDSLLEAKKNELSRDGSRTDAQSPKNYITFTFLGFYDQKRERMMERICVELKLSKASSKKRRESSNDEMPLVTNDVPVNPSEDHPPSKAPAISIASESFDLINRDSYTISFRVYPASSTQQSNPSATADLAGEENQEPTFKRRKMLRHSMDENRVLVAQLAAFDKQAKSLLTEGEYEVGLDEADSNGSSKVSSSWVTNAAWQKLDNENLSSEHFGNCATLKFRVSWTSERASLMVERPRPQIARDNATDVARTRDRSNKSSKWTSANGKASQKHVEKPPKIVYQFLYNKNARQLTEAREDLHCPWCSLNCMELVALLKHLKLFHPRFLFTYVPIEEGARIDVSVSELYDSTYAGNPHDLISQPPGLAFSRNGPVQRTTITSMLVYKPKRSPPSLSEFLEANCDDLNGLYDGQRPFVTGHNRLYHYSTTCLPMPPHAILQESTEDQVDPSWLLTKMCRMIDEFSDVNEGEKDFMKMWNMHIQHYTFVGDCQLNLALKKFVEKHGKELVDKNLYRNFVLHCCNLFQFGVIGSEVTLKVIHRLQVLIGKLGLKVSNDWKCQLSTWKLKKKKITADKVVETSNGCVEEVGNASATANIPRKDFSGLFKNDSAGKDRPSLVSSPSA